MTERVAVFPGSFDPATLGHETIARRALGLADRVIVAVARLAPYPKDELFAVEERVELLDDVFADELRIEVAAFGGLLVDFAVARGARMVVRGIRSTSDLAYEMQMAAVNRQLAAEIETVFLLSDPRHVAVSSTLVRRIARLGGEVGSFVSPRVLARIADRVRHVQPGRAR